MKNSNIQWIGDIPDNWEVSKVKSVCSVIGSGTTPTSGTFDYYDGGTINWIQSGDLYKKSTILEVNTLITDKALMVNKALKVYKKPFVVIAMYGASVGNVAISNIDACTNQACCVLKTNDKSFLPYLYYCMLCCKDDFLLRAEGGTQPNISQEKIKKQSIPLPPLATQTAIATYLDAKCSEIDGLIADINKQIETLNELKKSTITEAVTKGLNKNVKLKDSGIQWIGEIPEGWSVTKIKFHLRRNEPRNPGNAEVLSVYREYGVVPKNSRDDNHNVTSEDTSKYKFVRKGDLVINKMKAWQGSLAVSDYEGIVSPAYFIYNFTDEVFHKKYFHHLIRSCYKDEFRRLSTGIREGQWDLPSNDFDNTLVVIPPLTEQRDIAAYLDEKCAEFDSIISDKQKQISTLEAYKKSLIYEYVTGKKEVE